MAFDSGGFGRKSGRQSKIGVNAEEVVMTVMMMLLLLLLCVLLLALGVLRVGDVQRFFYLQASHRAVR